MKKLVLLALLIRVFFLISIHLASCNVVAANQISPIILTQEQRDIVDLIRQDTQQICFFSYEIDRKYNHLEVWGELYQEGELLKSNETNLDVSFNKDLDTEKPYQGKIVVIINNLSDPQWELEIGINENGNKTYMKNPFDSYALSTGVGISSPMTNPTHIENGKEIILFTTIFKKDGTGINSAGIQNLIDHPESVKDYSYACIIKCKFLSD